MAKKKPKKTLFPSPLDGSREIDLPDGTRVLLMPAPKPPTKVAPKRKRPKKTDNPS